MLKRIEFEEFKSELLKEVPPNTFSDSGIIKIYNILSDAETELGKEIVFDPNDIYCLFSELPIEPSTRINNFVFKIYGGLPNGNVLIQWESLNSLEMVVC